MVATSIIQKVDSDRLTARRGRTHGWCIQHYVSRDGRRQEISAYVANGDGKNYSVTLTEGRSFCGCGDSMFRGKVCKHAVALALYAIRTPRVESKGGT